MFTLDTNAIERPATLTNNLQVLIPILKAAKDGDADELERLLNQKSETYDSTCWPDYPNDWKYKYFDLLQVDEEGRTCLQLACSVGNHDMAMKCVQILCESLQVLAPESDDDERDKSYEYINYALPGKPSALHCAIENKATDVISYLLDKNANVAAKSLKGTNALTLICQQVPDALTEVYNNAIQLTVDHKGISIDLGPLIGVRRRGQITDPERSPIYNNKASRENSDSSSSDNNSLVVDLWKETEYLSYILGADNWGANLLLHPLVKLFLELKWKKVHWFFWVPFLLQILWLLLYAIAFVQLHVYVEDVTNHNATDTNSSEKIKIDDDAPPPSPPFVIWTVLFFIALFGTGKEIYVGLILKRAYPTFEKLAQISFIALFLVQFTLLLLGYLERVSTISVVGIAVSTILMIFQLGKTPFFGLQVAAMKKVIYSFVPHMPLFFVWFLGFCLIFWALFFKSNESSVIVLLAIVAAMGTGEINAKEHLEGSLSRSLELQDLISVFCLMLFIITIVTLYFNLLIGYAVSDIQLLKQEAEAYEMSNRLSTIYTTESFLLSKMGRFLVQLFHCGGRCRLLRKKIQQENNKSGRGSHMDSIYVIPPAQFQTCATLSLPLNKLPPKLMKQFKEIAYGNLRKEKERRARLMLQLEKLQQKGN